MSSEGWSIREGEMCCWVLWLVWGRGMRFWTGENGGTSHGAGWKQMRKNTTVCVCARVVMGVIFAWSTGVGSWVGATELGSTGGQGEVKQEWRGPGGAGGGRGEQGLGGAGEGRGEQGPLCCAAVHGARWPAGNGGLAKDRAGHQPGPWGRGKTLEFLSYNCAVS